MAQFASCWALCAGSLVIALPLLAMKIKDHTAIEEDLKFSDESFDEVAAQHQRAGSTTAVENGRPDHKDGLPGYSE